MFHPSSIQSMIRLKRTQLLWYSYLARPAILTKLMGFIFFLLFKGREISSLESVQLQKIQATNRHTRRFVRLIEHDSEFDHYLTRLNKSLIKLPL